MGKFGSHQPRGKAAMTTNMRKIVRPNQLCGFLMALDGIAITWGALIQNLRCELGLTDEQSKPIGKFCHIYWRHPTTTDCILGDCNVTYEPDGIERTQGYSFSNTPDEIRKWNKRSLSWDMNKAKWR